MIRAIFFDFNGVIVDDEPLHLKLFQKILEGQGVRLEREDYYAKYLGLDDHDCLSTVFKDQGKTTNPEKIQEWIQKKTAWYGEEIKNNPPFVPGVRELIKALGQTHYLAVVSGALRNEIEDALAQGGLKDSFSVIVAAGEMDHGKPSPEGYVKGLDLLNRDFVASSERLLPAECLVVEDSIWGIEAARGAGMPCIALTTSYPERDLPGALIYFKDFKNISAEKFLEKVIRRLKNHP